MVPSVIKSPTNGPVIAAAAELWIDLENDQILDATYGRGLFWTHCRPKHLLAFTDDFTTMPLPDAEFDVVIFDPPYIAAGRRSTSTIPEFNDRYGLGGTDAKRRTERQVADPHRRWHERVRSSTQTQEHSHG